MLEPLDLVYVCGNKFLATNSTMAPVQVTYRVVGTTETGSLTLPRGTSEDPGYSETDLETAGRGVVELYQDDQRVARRRNEGSPCGPPAAFTAALVASGPEAGNWSAPFPWPVVAVHLSLLPDGRVLSWGLDGVPQVWDPATGDFTAIPSPALLFCSGHSFLPDGRLLVSGGHIATDRGIPDNTLFSAGTESWSQSVPMRRGRWYPTNTTLASGAVVILAGRDEAGEAVAEPEVWSSGGVRVLSGAGRVLPYYPRTFLAPDGRIFYAGELRATRYLNTSGSGSWSTAVNRLYGTRNYGSAVMYDNGKILYAGGGRTTNTAEIIDLNAGSPTWRWTGSMAFPRRYHNATILPNGEVLVTGGTTSGINHDVTKAVRAAEVWNPATGTWTTLASNTVRRTYHSTSILLPDGRVLHSGSGDGANMPDERNAELFSPPYLSRGARPTIADAPSLVGYGVPFRVATPQAADIAKVSLVRLGSVTHAFDMNQRFQWLSFEREAEALNVSAPTSRNRTPPGHYMLFILDGNGVPSAAAIVKVGNESEPPGPTNTPPTADFTRSCTALACQFTDRSTDSDGSVTQWSWTFGDGGTSTAPNPSRTYTTAGTYDVTLTVTDNAEGTHARSAQVTVTAGGSMTLSASGSKDAAKHYLLLTWSGASGATVDVFMDGKFRRNTPNDGRHTVVKVTTQSTATYVLKVCNAGTSTCSNNATAAIH